MGLYWGYVGVILGLYWGYVGAILGLAWGYIGVILGLYWGYIGVTFWIRRRLQMMKLLTLAHCPPRRAGSVRETDLLQPGASSAYRDNGTQNGSYYSILGVT